MKLGALTVLGAPAIILAVAAGHSTAVDQETKPLERLLGQFAQGAAAWRQDNTEYVQGGELPRYWIREYRWGPGRDVLLADAYAVFEGERCVPLVHLVHTWDAEQERVPRAALFRIFGCERAGGARNASSSAHAPVGAIRAGLRQHHRQTDFRTAW